MDTLATCHRSGPSLTYLLLAGLAACHDGGGSAPAEGPLAHGNLRSAGLPGLELPKPGGGTFFLDPHQGGTRASLHLTETWWGRRVDVHDADDQGTPSAQPRFRDFVVEQGILSNGVDYTLTSNPITNRERLVVHAKHGSTRFAELLAAATDGLPAVVPKKDDGSSAPPFTTMPRNGCLVLRIDDLLDDDAAAELDLASTVHVFTGLPQHVPFAARLRFDPNHGGLAGGAFHSTRVLVDLTVSEAEALAHPVPLPVNPLGLPPASLTSAFASASLRIPTRLDPGSGQFVLLTSLAGVPLDSGVDPAIDNLGVTRDVVRALRAGNSADANNGFLLDVERPRVVGSLAVVVESAVAAGGSDFKVDLSFTSTCMVVPGKEDVLAVGEDLLEVLEPGSLVPPGSVKKLLVRALTPVGTPGELLGNGLLHAPFSPQRASRLAPACWLRFLPGSATLPAGVSPLAQIGVRFSEPMDPAPFDSLDALRVVRGPAAATSTAGASTTVPGEVLSSSGGDEFALSPLLPLAHEQGTAEKYHVELVGPTDLAGNPLRHALPFANFRLDPAAESQANGSILLSFESPDEVGPDGLPDLRGQFFYDLDRGVIRPRPVSVSSWTVDRTIPVPSIMIPFPSGVSTPLNPLGSKLQAVWRYCDAGWSVRDETKYNLDVSGLAWAPVGGLVVSDFYDGFEIRLAHSRFLPDESIDQNLLPRWPNSGLRGAPSPFTDNILVDPLSPQTVVHPRSLGYTVSSVDLFVTSSGTVMLPYPLNEVGAPFTSYTWRDTAVLAKAGPNNQGVPMDIETGPPLFLEPQAGTLAPAGSVPSIGLPLLIEYRCYPSNTGLGLNALDVSLAINSSALPAFRAYSSGGINSQGVPVVVNPDTSLVPTGGFDPTSVPPGQPTDLTAEDVFYIGQLETVTRISRVHTIWLDTGDADPQYLSPLVAPAPGEQPVGTGVLLEYRGAVGFSAFPAPFDATKIDAYGELAGSTADFLGGIATWTNDIGAMDGARYLQVRLTFVSNVATGESPELSALGISFQTD
jgi:hypothetical protein